MKQFKQMPECNCKSFDSDADFQHENRKIVSFEDKKAGKSKYKYNNNSNNHLARYRIDGGLIKSEDKKCDYLLLNCEKKQAYFIELKGSDIIQAIKQLDESIDLLKNRLPNFAFFARIVLTRVPPTELRALNL